MYKKLISRKPADYISYKKLTLPKVFENESSFVKRLRKEVSFQAQGDAVEIDENSDIEILMIALDVLRKVSPEVVFTLQSGEKILLFDHQAGPVLRPKNVISEFVKERFVIGNGTSLKRQEIDIESVWRKEAKADFIAPETNLFIKELAAAVKGIKQSLKPAKVTILKGKKPKFLLLMVQYLSYGISREIWYKESGSRPAVVTK